MKMEASLSPPIKYTEHTNVTNKLLKPTSQNPTLTLPKTIRFSVLDENATDDSSSDGDEEVFPRVRRVKKHVNQINIVTRPSKKMKTKGAEQRPIGEKKYKGIVQRASGKWKAQIQDINVEGRKKRTICLGTFERAEEAAKAYNEAAIRIRGNNAKPNVSIPSSQDQEVAVAATQQQPSGENKYKGVRQKPSGRWSAQIQGTNINGSGKHSIALGTFATAEEAAKAYNEAAIRLWGNRAKINVIVPPKQKQNLCLSPNQPKKYKGVRQETSGKWSAVIRDSRQGKKRIWLGAFDTAEAAAKAYSEAALRKRCRNAKIDVLATPSNPMCSLCYAPYTENCKATYQNENLVSSPNSVLPSEAVAAAQEDSGKVYDELPTVPELFGGNSMFDSNWEFLQFQPI